MTFQPGSIYKESDCKICQCIDNVYVCDTQSCGKVIVTDHTIEKPRTDDSFNNTAVIYTKPKVIISTITPPADCETNK